LDFFSNFFGFFDKIEQIFWQLIKNAAILGCSHQYLVFCRSNGKKIFLISRHACAWILLFRLGCAIKVGDQVDF